MWQTFLVVVLHLWLLHHTQEFGLVAWGSRRDALLAPWSRTVSAAELSASPGATWKLGELLRADTSLLYAPVFSTGVCVGKTGSGNGSLLPKE